MRNTFSLLHLVLFSKNVKLSYFLCILRRSLLAQHQAKVSQAKHSDDQECTSPVALTILQVIMGKIIEKESYQSSNILRYLMKHVN